MFWEIKLQPITFQISLIIYSRFPHSSLPVKSTMATNNIRTDITQSVYSWIEYSSASSALSMDHCEGSTNGHGPSLFLVWRAKWHVCGDCARLYWLNLSSWVEYYLNACVWQLKCLIGGKLSAFWWRLKCLKLCKPKSDRKWEDDWKSREIKNGGNFNLPQKLFC